MIDDGWIESIKDECDELVSEGLGHYLVSNEAGAIRALIIRLRQAEKDAARYRWLRDESAFTHSNAPLAFFTDTNGDQISFDFDGSSYSVLHDEILDAALDEAMNASNN